MNPGHYPEGPRLRELSALKDLFELEQQARVPDSIKCLSDVKKDV
jgi:hypothetical protein